MFRYKNRFHEKGKRAAAIGLAGVLFVLSFVHTDLQVNASKEEGQVDHSISGELELCMNHDKKDMEQYLEGFRAKYPDVELTYSTYADYEKNMAERIITGDYGDVLLIPSGVAQNDISSLFEPLGIAADFEEKYNYVENYNQQDGIIYGIVSFAYLHGIVYNKAVFDQAGIARVPDTTEEFLYDMGLIKEHTDAIPFYTNYNIPWAITYWNIFPFIEMTGASGYKYNDFLTQENPFSEGTSYYEVFRLLYDMVEKGYTEEIPGQLEWSELLKAIHRGEVASMVCGSWAVQQVKHSGTHGSDIGFMAFPANVEGNQYSSVGFDYSYGISAKSKNKEAARVLLDYMLNESGYALGTGNISIVKADPYPEYIDEMNQVNMLYDTYPSGDIYTLWDSMHKYVYPGSMEETLRIVEAGAGMREESFDDIMQEWNHKWEMGRPETSKKNADEGSKGYANTVVTVDNSSLILSETEITYIGQKRQLNVGYLRTWAPFTFEDKDGNFTGLLRNICEVISEKTGLGMNYFGYDSMDAMVADLNEDKLDLVAGVEMTFPMYGIKYSKSFFNFLNVYVISPNVDITKIDEYIFAAPEDFPYVNENYVKRYADIRKCIEAVERERANYASANYYTANYYYKDLGCTMAEIVPASKYSSMHFAFPGDVDPSLIALVNKCLYTIPEEDLQVQILEYSSPLDSKFTIEKFVRTNPIVSVLAVIIFSMFLIAGISIILFQKEKSSKEQSLAVKKYTMLANLADEYMFEYNIIKQEFTFDAKFQNTFGFPVSTTWQVNQDIEQLHRFVSKMDQYCKNPDSAEIPFELQKDNGESIWFRIMVSVMEDDDKNQIYWIGKMVNVQKEIEEMQIYQEKAEKDSLTQVYNRRGFYEQLPMSSDQVLFAVMDLDNFKSVNDQMGHSGGDEVLKMLAEQMRRNLGESAIIGRYGGDEFVCFLDKISIEEAEDRLKWLVKCMDTNVNIQGMKHVVSISVGAIYSAGKIATADLFEMADEVLYDKKNDGKNGYLIKQIQT